MYKANTSFTRSKNLSFEQRSLRDAIVCICQISCYQPNSLIENIVFGERRLNE